MLKKRTISSTQVFLFTVSKSCYFYFCILLSSLFTNPISAQVNIDTTFQNMKDSVIQLHDSVKIDTLAPNKIKSQKEKKSSTIEGVILDYTTSEPLSFATIYFSGTNQGMRADIDGKFKFIVENIPSDTLIISVIGYAKKAIQINPLLPYQKLNIVLERGSVQIKNVIFKYDRNPALTLVKKVIKNKPFNNYDKANNYSYEVYNKLEMDINKIPKKSFKQSPILKKFDFIQQYIDSTSEENLFYLYF